MSQTMNNLITKFKPNISPRVKEKLLELDKKGILQKEGSDNKLYIHSKDARMKLNPPDSGCDSMHEFVYGHIMFIKQCVCLSGRCSLNLEVLDHPGYSQIYKLIDNKLSMNMSKLESKKEKNNYKKDFYIKDSDRFAIKINDENVDEIIDSINALLPELSEDYLKMIRKYN